MSNEKKRIRKGKREEEAEEGKKKERDDERELRQYKEKTKNVLDG